MLDASIPYDVAMGNVANRFSHPLFGGIRVFSWLYTLFSSKFQFYVMKIVLLLLLHSLLFSEFQVRVKEVCLPNY